jgi:CBS domain-containing protein
VIRASRLPAPEITVRDLMSRNVLVLREDASVGRADADMKLRHIRHFPVVGPLGDVTGVVASIDLARALAHAGHGRAVAVKDIMTRRPITVNEDVPAHEAALLLRARKINSLPVLSSDGSLVGIITASDFLAVAEHALAGRGVVVRTTRAGA